MKDKLRLALLIGCGVLLLLFIILNRDSIDVSFVFWTMRAPIFVVIILSAVLGATLAYAIRVFRSSKKEKA